LFRESAEIQKDTGDMYKHTRYRVLVWLGYKNAESHFMYNSGFSSCRDSIKVFLSLKTPLAQTVKLST